MGDVALIHDAQRFVRRMQSEARNADSIAASMRQQAGYRPEYVAKAELRALALNNAAHFAQKLLIELGRIQP